MGRALSQEEFSQRILKYTKNTVDVISEYKNRKTKVRVRCKVCGFEWEICPSIIMPNTMSQHSFSGCPNCKYEEVECKWCHKKIRRLKSELLKNPNSFRYCSKDCANKHKNSLVYCEVDGSNYRRNAFIVYPHKCDICGWNEDERILEVHHLDENRKNNKIENLRILCPICHKKITLHLYSYEDLKNKTE